MEENIEKIIDNNLYKIFSQNIYIPKSFTSTIQTIEYKNKRTKERINLKKIAVTFAVLLISMNIVVYAYKIIESYKSETSIGYVSESLQNAVENGYIQNVDMEYVYSKGLGTKIEYLVMDDYNLNILFNFDTSNIKNNNREANIEDLTIYDENNNIIFCYDYNKYKKFCKEKKIKYNNESIEQYSNGYGMQLIELSENTNKTLYTIRSTKGFPKSKKLYIQFNQVSFDNGEKQIKGNWNMELNLNEKFYNREGINYVLENQNENISLISAKVTNTTMRITYKINDIDISKVSDIDMYIEDQNGNRYDVNNIEDSISVYIDEISATFPITTENKIEKFKLYILLNGNLEYTVNLIKTTENL